MVLSLPFSLKKAVKRNSMGRPVHIEKDDDSTTSTSSTSSTSTASSDAKLRMPLSSSSDDCSSKQRSVRFADVMFNEYHANTLMTKNEVKDLWYSAMEYRFFRSVALDASQHITATEKRNRAPYSYQRVLERAYTVCSQVGVEPVSKNGQCNVLEAADFVHLQRWLEVATSRVGLEKWSIRSIANDKVVRRQTLNAAVLQSQHKSRSPLYFVDYDTDEENDNSTAEAMRLECERLSRPSRLFSHTLAMALAAAVQKEYDEQVVAAAVAEEAEAVEESMAVQEAEVTACY
jgi:hypothetical protein